MKNKASIIVVLLIAIIAVFSTAYCFADNTLLLTKIDDASKLDTTNILSAFSDEYLALHEDDEVVVIAEYSDSSAHDISADLNLLGIEAQDRYSYSNIFNGQSFTIKIKDIASLSSLSYIKNVTLAEQYYTQSISTSGYTSESGTIGGIINNTTAYTGQGTVVAIVDSEFDVSHAVFSETPSGDLAMTSADIKSVLYDLNAYEQSGVSYQNLYVSKKVAYAYDYGEGDTDLYSTVDEHGTHVAGIIAGKSSTITGVVPDAQLALMKVADSSGVMYNDTIAAALEDCLVLDVDVVNMSLGSYSGFEVEEDTLIYKAVVKLKEAGVSVVCASGNNYTSAYGGDNGTNLATSSNVDNSVIGSPATFDETISVGNVKEARWFELNATKITYTNAYNSSTSKYVEFSQEILQYIADNSLPSTIDYVVLKNEDSLAYGKAEDYTGVNVEGKIVVVKRGEITFEEKVQNAKANGAIGIIFVNNSSTTIMPSITSTFTACIVTSDYGELLMDNAASNVGQITFNDSFVKTIMHDSSSNGVTNDLNLGVDIVSYGTSVYSSGKDQTYVEKTGTSMSTPNITGVYAAMIGYVKAQVENNVFESLDKVQIATIANKLIMSNTDLLTDLEDVLISPRSQGAGLANIEDATSALAYISTSDAYKTKIELSDNVSSTITLSFEIENYNTFELVSTLDVYVLTELLKDGNMSGNDKELTFNIVSVSNSTKVGDVYTISTPSKGKTSVEVVLELTQEAIDYLDLYEDGIYVEGYVAITDSTHSISLSCPFIGFYGDWEDVEILDKTAYEVSDDNKAYMRASTSYGIYAGSYYIPLGQFAYKLDDDQETPDANEEFAALSIYSSSMYALGYIQLGLLRNADYIEIEVIDTITGKSVYTTSTSYVQKTTYLASYSMLYGGDFSVSISPYSLDLYNNGQYEVIVSVYRDYDKDSDSNVVSGTYTQKFYVDEDAPEIENIDASTQGDKYYATFTLSDNHYLQALAICTGTGSSVTNVTLNVEDMYPIATVADGVGKTVKVTYDLTEAIKNATNGYLYFYLEDYAFNSSVYYYSIENWDGASSSIESQESNNQTTDSSKPTTDKNAVDKSTIAFTQTEIEVSVNKEVDLASSNYLKNYDADAKYTWSSSDTEVLAISSGKITGLQQGVAIVYIQDSDGNQDSLTVSVKASEYDSATYESTYISSYEMVDSITNDGNPFFGIKLSSSKIELAPGESFTLSYGYKPYNYNYIQTPISITVESSDPTKVSVNAVSGIISAVGSGDATLTIKANGVLVKTYNVTVADSVYINDDGVLLACFSNNTSIDLSSDDFIAIGANALSYAKYATTVTLPDTCKVISANAFYGNTSIQSVDIANVTTIGKNAFYGCSSLTSIDLSNVSSVGSNAFYGCVNLVTVSLDADNLQTMSITSDAFVGCLKLNEFTISGTYTSDKANIVIDGELKLTVNASKVVSDSTITAIGEGALANVNAQTVDLSSMNLTRIEAGAFKGNAKIKRVYLPSTIEYIGISAFENCTALQVVSIAKTTNQEITIASKAFYNTQIATIDLRGIKTSYGDYVFAVNSKMTSAYLGQVQKMGKYTFAATEMINKVVFESGSIDLGTYTFAPITINSKTYYHKALREVDVPSSISTINEYVFAYCSALKADYIDFSNITEVKDYAFLSCTSLNTIEMPKIEKLGYAAFAQSSIQSVSLNKNMTSGTLTIGELAFYKCEYLEAVYLPTNDNTSVEIKLGAFYNCTNICNRETKTVRVGPTSITKEVGINLDRVTSIGDYAFTSDQKLTSLELPVCTDIGYAAFGNCEKLESISIPSIENIGGYAFYSTAIESVTIPATIKSIGQAAFCDTKATIKLQENADYTASNLKIDAVGENNVLYIKLEDGTYMLLYYPQTIKDVSYTVLDNTSAIGEYAFEGNTSLVTAILPASITSIGNGAFFGCTRLTFVDYKGTTIPKLLGAYNSSTGTTQCNFISYDQDAVAIALIVDNEDIIDTFEANKTWNELCDYYLIPSAAQKIRAFVEKALAMEGQSITDENKSQFVELKNLYNSLSDDEKDALQYLTGGEVALKSYNAQLKEYNSSTSIIDNIADKIGINKWVLGAIIGGVALVLVLGAAGIAFVVNKRRREINKIKESSDESKSLEEIFGTFQKEERIDEDSVFVETKNEGVKKDGADSPNKEE